MSAGPGKLQKAILDNLSANFDNLPILFRRLLWEIAFDRDGIQKTGRKFRSSKAIIEEGIIKKSFYINLHRAINSLVKSERIIRTKNKITDLDSTLLHLPYITSKLEIYQLRAKLLPSIRKYIDREKPSIIHRDFNPFAYQVETLRKNKDPEYKTLQNEWETIERSIVKLLENTDFERFELWLSVLVWGRYHFRGRKCETQVLPILNRQTPEEKLVATRIDTLINKVKSLPQFKIGENKKVLYTLFSAPRYGGVKTSDQLIEFLFKENETLLRSLHGDKDAPLPRKIGSYTIGALDGKPRDRTYSPLLNQLFDRHIFRKLSFIDLPK